MEENNEKLDDKIEEVEIRKEDLIVVSLVNYFMVQKNYSPVILYGIDSEIWFENLNAEYKIIRIITGKLKNADAVELEYFRYNRIINSLKRKTFSTKLKTLSIVVCSDENMPALKNNKNNTYIVVNSINDITSNETLLNEFPSISELKEFDENDEESMMHALNLKYDIDKHNYLENEKLNNLFDEKPLLFTTIMPAFVVILFLLISFMNGSEDKYLDYALYTSNINIFDAITSVFLSASFLSMLCSLLAFTSIFKTLETVYKKSEIFITIVLITMLSILAAIALNVDYIYSIDYITSSAIAMVIYFGIYYRVFFVKIYKDTVVPSILFLLLNCAFGFTNPLILFTSFVYGGLLAMMYGVPNKNTSPNRLNGMIMFVIFTIFLILLIR